MIDSISKIIKYVERVGIALSVLFNVLTGGHSNQTFSARNYGWKREGNRNFVWLIDRIFFIEEKHCLTSWSYWYIRHNLADDKKTLDIISNIPYSLLHDEQQQGRMH